MTNVHDQAAKPMELGEALKDLGWLPILLMGAGGLSILDILEAAVYYDLSLVTPFQIALDGYRRVVGLIGAAIEPGLRSALDWLALNWQWHLRLQPYWLSLFVLGMMFVMSVVRVGWRSGRRISAIVMLVFQGAGMLLGCAVAGLVPKGSGWEGQGLIAAAPLVANTVIGGVGATVVAFAQRNIVAASQAWAVIRSETLPVGSVMFLLGAGISLIPGFASIAGIAALAALIVIIGIGSLAIGLHRGNLELTRGGLTMLGGFIAAGLILLSNWVVAATA